MCDRGAVQLMGLVGVVVVKKELLIGLNGALRVQRDMTFSTRKDVADFNVGLKVVARCGRAGMIYELCLVAFACSVHHSDVGQVEQKRQALHVVYATASF